MDVRFTLRFPAELRDKLSKKADENTRSLNGEIVRRLLLSLSEEESDNSPPHMAPTETDMPKTIVDAINKAESFISGFEGDEVQEGIPELLAQLRAATKAAETADDLLHRNLAAWDDEEDSVKEEHEDLITDLRNFLEGK